MPLRHGAPSDLFAVTPHPYRYPANPLRRKHGPQGYSKHRYYHPWLRDEFDFRCAYCLLREVWGQISTSYEIEHFLPKALNPDLALDYDNLVYACANCNRRKSTRLVPDPAAIAYGKCLEVDCETGEITPLNDEGIRLIDELALDEPQKTRQRLFFLDAMRGFMSNPAKLRLYMGLPTESELPDLAKPERKPKDNSKPAGVEDSWLARLRRGDVPDYME